MRVLLSATNRIDATNKAQIGKRESPRRKVDLRWIEQAKTHINFAEEPKVQDMAVKASEKNKKVTKV